MLNFKVIHEGSYIFYQQDQPLEKGKTPLKNNELIVHSNEFLVTRKGPVLSGPGGDCRIITFFNPDYQLAALTHINVSEIRPSSRGVYTHEKILLSLFKYLPQSIRNHTAAHIFGDIYDPNPTLSQELNE